MGSSSLKNRAYCSSPPRPAERPGNQAPRVEEKTGQKPDGRLKNTEEPPLNPLELVINEFKIDVNVGMVVCDDAVE